MIFHVNRLTYKADVTAQQRRDGLELLRQQGESIDAVKSFVVGPYLGGDYELGAVFVIEDLEGYWEYLTDPAHFRSEKEGLHLVERFEAFDVTDSDDPEMEAKIARLHARSYEENVELAELVASVPSFAVPDGSNAGPGDQSVTVPTSVDAGAPVVARHEIRIQAPLTSVWALHVDVNGWTAWNSDMTSAHLDGPFAPGATFHWESYGFPVTSSVYEVEPHRRILWGGTAGGITGVHEWLFTPVAGGVHVETNESFAGAPVDADTDGMQSLLDASLEDWLRHLKEASEATTAV